MLINLKLKKEDLISENLMQGTLKSLKRERLDLEAKLADVRECISYLGKELSLKEMRKYLAQKDIKAVGERVQLNYLDLTPIGVTVGICEGHTPGLKVHLRLKSKKGWRQDITIVTPDIIDIVEKTLEDLPDPPKMGKNG